MTAPIPALLQPLKDRLAGFENLCPEYLRQSIRHVQRNCDIECNDHEDEASWDACKQPDRYDGDRMAHALSESAKLIAAIETVAALHPYSGGHLPEQLRSETCPGCLEIHPCPTVTALTQALGGDGA